MILFLLNKRFILLNNFNYTKLQRLFDSLTLTLIFKLIIGTESNQVLLFKLPLWIYILITTSLLLPRSGIYKSFRSSSLFDLTKRVLTFWSILNFSIITMAFVSNISIDRKPFGLWSISSLLFLVLHHVIIRKLIRFLRVKGINTKNILYWGNYETVQLFANDIYKNKWLGMNLTVWFSPNENDLDKKISFLPNCLGGFHEMKEWLKKNKVDLIIFSNLGENKIFTSKLLALFGDTSIPIAYAPEWGNKTMRFKIDNINNQILIKLWGDDFPVIDIAIKKIFDIIFSFLGLIILSPIFLIISLAIYIEDKGPIIFTQKRSGLNGKKFNILKFRSMKVMELGDKTVLKQACINDPRVTKVGGFLRKWSLDELPQLLNVLKGEMSFVGPRPHAIEHNELYRKVIPGYMQRHSVYPGITGLSQVYGLRGETKTLDDMKRRIEADLEYLSQWNLYLDLKILISTIINLYSDKAY